MITYSSFLCYKSIRSTIMACIFGDITRIITTGASEETVKQDNLDVRGADASYKMAEVDLKRIDQYKTLILNVGRAKQMDPAVIAGIISRETRGGLYLTKEGYQKDGKGFGLMQVDTGFHSKRGAWNSEEHITQATEILISYIKTVQKDFPTWPKEHQLKGGIATYNKGPHKITTYETMDAKTTRKDYSSDVVARAQWFKRHGY